MKPSLFHRLIVVMTTATTLLVSRPAISSDEDRPLSYPSARLSDVVDTYHGTDVPDPYRWLEDPDAPESRTWIEAQNDLTFGWLGEIAERDQIRQRLETLWNYERFGIPFSKGDRYFFTKNDGLQNQSVLYVSESLEAEPRVLLDPNLLSEDGTVALSGAAVSQDGDLLAYGLAEAGSDWNRWKIRDIRTGDDLPETLQWIKFSSVSWLPDGSGFYYCRYPKPVQGQELEALNSNMTVAFHKVGTDQAADTEVYARPDEPSLLFGAEVSEDGRFLIITARKGTDAKEQVLCRDLEADSAFVTLVEEFADEFTFLGNEGATLFFKTDRGAPKGRVVAFDFPTPETVVEIVPEAEETLRGVSLIGDQFIASYLRDARSLVKVYDLNGKPIRDVELPGLGTAGGFGGDRSSTETFYAFNSFTAPSTIYRYDLDSGESTLFRRPQVAFDAEQYTTEQVFYTSKDGTRVPMFVSYKKGLERNGKNPTLLYGYGGFNISITPSFSVSNLVWMEMGGVYAVPNIRGGGEYGEAWHRAGTKQQKQNVFDDFIAAAEYLIAERYTSTPRLAIFGGSNGGLLVGACITQRPDLFGAAMPAVGVLDMLRFHRFTIGYAWTDDYGCSDNPSEFEALYEYSPLHNVESGTAYPPTLITTADHDDRVVPAHSFKFAATLQAAQSGPNPILIRIDTDAGHGAGKPIAKVIDEAADRLGFLVRTLQVEVDLPSATE